MQALLMKGLEAAAINLLPRIEPLAEKLFFRLARRFLTAARDKQLPAKYKVLEEVLDGLCDELLKALPADK